MIMVPVVLGERLPPRPEEPVSDGLALTIATALAVPAAPTPTKPGIDHAPTLLPLEPGEQYRFVFDAGVCVGCHSCEVACAEQNQLPTEVRWRRVGEVEGGRFPDTRRFNISMACNHCLEPACLIGCPTEAYVKLANGVVDHHANDCIGCGYCTWNCPYSVPVFWAEKKVVTKCDMCKPRLEAGLTSACVDACPTHAIGIEKVNVEAWRADHRDADGLGLPPSDLSLSTTRIIHPREVPPDLAGATHEQVELEDPHWPLIVLTLLTQVAVGTTLATTAAQADGGISSTTGALVALLAGAVALVASLGHLSRPLHAWKALRNLRRSWLSREVACFGAYTALAAVHAALTLADTTVAPWCGLTAGLVGLTGVYASGRLYLVPARPAWDTPLTLLQFLLTSATLGALAGVTVLPAEHLDAGIGRLLLVAAIAGVVAAVATLVAVATRLGLHSEREWRGSLRLLVHHCRGLLVVRVGTLLVTGALIALALNVHGDLERALVIGAFGLALLSELTGRYLFYVTVVPRTVPGRFSGNGSA